jgi:uncharacterized protein (DUF433 family)
MQVDNTLLNRITINPKVMVGKPVVRGMRITVEQILKSLAAGIQFEELKQDYPFLEQDDIKACLLYASNLVGEETIHSIAV